jgi:hypothetical protein
MSETPATNTNEDTMITLRVPTALKAALQELAESEHRTLSGQVRAILDEATATQGDTK